MSSEKTSSSVKAADMLEQAADTLQKYASAVERLQTENAELRHAIRVNKLAHRMFEHGAASQLGSDLGEVEENLRGKTAGEIQRMEDALAMLGPNMADRMGKLASRGGDTGAGAGSTLSRAAVDDMFQG